MDLPYWYKLLDYFEKKRYFSNGLTIPYLIGARRILEPNTVLLTIKEFLNQASLKTLPKPVSILKCGNINEFVFGLLDSETLLIKKQYKNLYKEIDNLIFLDKSFDHVPDIAGVISQLSEAYEPLISNKQYSKNDGLWDDFPPIEITRLKEINVINN